jgi:hypothetical protein
MTHQLGVMVAQEPSVEPGVEDIELHPGFPPPCLSASQSMATFPNGSYLAGASRNVVENWRTSKNKTQTQEAGEKEDLLH